LTKVGSLNGTGYSLWNGVFVGTIHEFTPFMKFYYDVKGITPEGEMRADFNAWAEVTGGNSCFS
jgi:hypothetical protein